MQNDEILLTYGWDAAAMARQLAEAADLAELIGDRQARVGLKPNLVVARPAEEGATTHPGVAEGLIQYLQAHGFNNLVILEGSWVGDRTGEAFRRCGYEALAAHYGVGLVDTQKDRARSVDAAGLRLEICESALNLDFLINLPVIKGHCQTRITCALKNSKGLIPNSEKSRYHRMGLHKPIAHLNTCLPQSFIVADGICGDLDFEEGGNPVPSGLMLAARDPVLCDAWVAGLLGYGVEEIPYIGLAAELGVGSADTAGARVCTLARPVGPQGSQRAGRKALQLAPYIQEADACSACYAALVRALAGMEPISLNRLPAPVCVGQGYRGKGGALGVGACCAGFDNHQPGCPPTAGQIREMLERLT